MSGVVARRALLLLLLALAGCRRTSAEAATDLEGRVVDPLASGHGVAVLVFVGTECPISNRYAPELTRLRDAYASRGVEMFLVYPSTSETTERIRAHLRDYALTLPALRDPHHALVRRAEVTTTPEAAVFRNGALTYVGRIDDRQVDFGVTRPEATRHDLAVAIDESLAGLPVTTPRTTPVGCTIPGTR